MPASDATAQPASQQSLPAKILTLLLSAALLVLGFMFSLVALAIAAIVVLGLGGWFWWKTRALRKALREGMPPGAMPPGAMPQNPDDIIEGEFVRETPRPADASRLLR